MAKQTFGANITGTKGTTYDLDAIQANSRTNSEQTFVAHIWEWDPNSEDPVRRNSNPPNLKTGQMWLSKRVGK